MAESELECFIGVKTAESSKTEWEIERKKKHKNVNLKEAVPAAILPREKTEECTVCYRSSIQISVSKQTYIFSLDTSYFRIL